MAANELKPCQCGSDVELCRGDDDYYIYCPKCKLKTFSDRVYDNITDNCDRLIEVWNRRAKDEPESIVLEKIVARLRGEFTNLIPDERPNAIVYNMGYAAAIRDLEHIVDEVIDERRGEDGKSE